MSEQESIDRLTDLRQRAEVARTEGMITGIMSDLSRQIDEIRRLNAEHSRRMAEHGWHAEQKARTPAQLLHMRWYWRCYYGIYGGTLNRWEDDEED